MRRISISVDVEQDCPPFLESTFGLEEGMPKLLDIFRDEGVKATFFATGKSAELFPNIIEMILEDGHELGCHGYSHERFDHLTLPEARTVISMSKKVLDKFGGDVESFRAPNLKFPEKYLMLLDEEGFRIDSSIASYKFPFYREPITTTMIRRIPVSVTSSFLRLPLYLNLPILCRMNRPVLFVHPWEFIDMRKFPVRFDCKFNTGVIALRNLRAIISYFKSKSYRFLTIKEMALSTC